MTITHTYTLERLQIMGPTQADPYVERWCWDQLLVDGTEQGVPAWVKLKIRPLSSFSDKASLLVIQDSDLED